VSIVNANMHSSTRIIDGQYCHVTIDMGILLCALYTIHEIIHIYNYHCQLDQLISIIYRNKHRFHVNNGNEM